MNSAELPTAPTSAFFSEVYRKLSPSYRECFSDETRRTRNQLLFFASLLLLTAVGVVSLSHELSLKVHELELPLIIVGQTRWILVAISLYFWLLFVTRSFAEWKLWRLGHQGPITQIVDLADTMHAQLDASFDALYRNANERFALLSELGKTFDKTPAEIGLQQALESAQAKFDASSQAKLDTAEDFGRHNESFEKLNQLSDRLRVARKEREDWMQPERERLKQKIATLGDLAKATDPERDALSARLNFLLSAIRPASWLLKARLWIEMLFPLLFGLTAIALGAALNPHV